MKPNFGRLGAVMLCAWSLFCAGGAVGAEAEEGFKPLFNGRDLSGWDGNPKFWSVKEGVVTGRTTAENPTKGNTFLIWRGGEVADFELRLSYRIVGNNDKKQANSGIQYRSKDRGNWVINGYQADFEAGKTYSGILYEEGGRGILAQRGEKVVIKEVDGKRAFERSVLGKSDEIQSKIRSEDWNDYLVIAKGNHLQHFINGVATVDVTDLEAGKSAASGLLALQLHAGPPMTVEFKNVRLKVLGGDAEKLQGRWVGAVGTFNGNPLGQDQLDALTLKFDGEKYESAWSSGSDNGTYVLEEGAKPRGMNLNGGLGMAKAIYEVAGDELRMCYSFNGADRPKEFSAEQDSGRLLVTYRRKK